MLRHRACESFKIAELQIKRGNRDDLGTIFHISLLKHVVAPQLKYLTETCCDPH